MGKLTGIEWTDGTLNTAWGCSKVSSGCKNCYMYRLSPGFGRDPNKPTPFKMENIKKRLRQIPEGSKIFLNSMRINIFKSLLRLCLKR